MSTGRGGGGGGGRYTRIKRRYVRSTITKIRSAKMIFYTLHSSLFHSSCQENYIPIFEEKENHNSVSPMCLSYVAFAEVFPYVIIDRIPPPPPHPPHPPYLALHTLSTATVQKAVCAIFPLTGEGHTRSIVCLCFIGETDIDVNVMNYIYTGRG